MKTKHKRLIVIGCCIAWGMFAICKQFVSSRVGYPKEAHIFEHICLVSCQAAIKVYFELDFVPIPTKIFLYKVLFVIQFLMYLSLGTIISYLIYSPWRKTKTPSEPTVPPVLDK